MALTIGPKYFFNLQSFLFVGWLLARIQNMRGYFFMFVIFDKTLVADESYCETSFCELWHREEITGKGWNVKDVV
jgi:hypothetical protein